MGWGQVPSEARAAEEAARQAREAAENRPMSPFERQVVGVLEDIRDAVKACAPKPLDPIQGIVGAVELGCCADGGLDALLDSPPARLSRAVAAGASALYAQIPALREDFTAAGFEKLSEVVIEAALHDAARGAEPDVDTTPTWRVGGPSDTKTSAVQQSGGDESAGGEAGPPAPPAGAP